MKDAAQDEAQDVVQDLSQDVAQDLAENVLGAAEDGGVKVLILPIVIFQWRRAGSRGALLVDPRVRACAATGARRRRHIGPPSHTTTTTTTTITAAASAAAKALRTRRGAFWRTFWRALRRALRRTWPSGPGRHVPSSRRHQHRRSRLCAARAEMAAHLGSSVAFGSGCGQALPGVPRKAPLC